MYYIHHSKNILYICHILIKETSSIGKQGNTNCTHMTLAKIKDHLVILQFYHKFKNNTIASNLLETDTISLKNWDMTLFSIQERGHK